jgi:hypothetical protein
MFLVLSPIEGNCAARRSKQENEPRSRGAEEPGRFGIGSEAVIAACIEVHRHLGPERLLPVHEAQVITYLKLSGLPVGLLVNFHTAAIRHGLRRLTNNKKSPRSWPPC